MSTSNENNDPWDIVSIQRKHEENMRNLQRWIIVETEDGFTVHSWNAEGVAPPTTYSTKEIAAARLLQVMKITHAVVPQRYPKTICIEIVKHRNEDD